MIHSPMMQFDIYSTDPVSRASNLKGIKITNSTYVGEESQSWKVIHPFLDSFFLSCPSFPLLSSVMLRVLSLFQALLVL